MKRTTAVLLFLVANAVAIGPAAAAKLPDIRLNLNNQVPVCVKPDRLMKYVRTRNPRLPSSFDDVASHYKAHGERLGLRWDYAFFQMLVETNFLKFRTPSGRPGDVRAHQNNFAGLGATGGGEPGESFPDVSTGVLAHLQHVLMYSGKQIADPVAARTRKVQPWLASWTQSFGRPVTFTDLTTKWSPTDSGYSDDIESVARKYRRQHCTGNEAETRTASLKTPENESVVCRVWKAQYENSQRGLLIRSVDNSQTINYTALAVRKGLETKQADAYIQRYAKGGAPIATFASYDQALNKAFELCPKG